MRSLQYISAALLLLALTGIGHAADELKVVVLDSKTGHAMKGKLVCINVPPNPRDPVVERVRDCQRTDSGGIATFALSDPPPVTVDVTFGSDGLVPCYAPHNFAIADAMKTGTVARNTCGDASTDTTETGEVVVFGHQKSLKEAANSVRNEW